MFSFCMFFTMLKLAADCIDYYTVEIIFSSVNHRIRADSYSGSLYFKKRQKKRSRFSLQNVGKK